jgi:hypothetical protein
MLTEAAKAERELFMKKMREVKMAEDLERV